MRSLDMINLNTQWWIQLWRFRSNLGRVIWENMGHVLCRSNHFLPKAPKIFITAKAMWFVLPVVIILWQLTGSIWQVLPQTHTFPIVVVLITSVCLCILTTTLSVTVAIGASYQELNLRQEMQDYFLVHLKGRMCHVLAGWSQDRP